MRLLLLPILSFALIPTAGSAGPGDVNAHAFYTDAQELKGKGMGAMFDKRIKPMMAQFKDAAERVKAENESATARGMPVYCPGDPKAKRKMGPDRLVAMLGGVPEAQRKRSTLTQAWRAAMVREFPCG